MQWGWLVKVETWRIVTCTTVHEARYGGFMAGCWVGGGMGYHSPDRVVHTSQQ